MSQLGWALVLVLLLVGAGVLWFLPTDAPPSISEPLLSDEETGPGPRLGAAARLPEAPAEAEIDPFADVDDVRDLLGPLADYRQASAAGKRLAALLGRDPEQIRSLLHLLHPSQGRGSLSNHATLRVLTEVLCAIGTPALQVLMEELRDPHAVYRTQLDALIGGFGPAGAPAVPRLIEQLDTCPEDPPAAEAASVVNAMARIGPAAKGILPDLYRWLDEGATEDVEIAAAAAIVPIGGASERTWDEVRALLRAEGWPRQRGAALGALCVLGAEAAPMIPTLLGYVEEGVLAEYAMLHTVRWIGVPDPALVAWLRAHFRAETYNERAFGEYGRTMACLGSAAQDEVLTWARERGSLGAAHLPLACGPPPPRGPRVSWERLWSAMAPALEDASEEIRTKAYLQLAQVDDLPQTLRARLALRALREEAATPQEIGVGLAGGVEPLGPALGERLVALARASDETQDRRDRAFDVLAAAPAWRGRAWTLLEERLAKEGRRRGVLLVYTRFLEERADEVMARWHEAVEEGTLKWKDLTWQLGQVPPELLRKYPAAAKVRDVARTRPR